MLISQTTDCATINVSITYLLEESTGSELLCMLLPLIDTRVTRQTGRRANKAGKQRLCYGPVSDICIVTFFEGNLRTPSRNEDTARYHNGHKSMWHTDYFEWS